MSFVERKDGVIVAIFANAQRGRAEEELKDDDPEIIAFKQPKPIPKSDIELRIEALEIAKVDHETRLKAVEEKEAEITRLRAEVAKMDGDGDGAIGGSKPRA